MTPYSRNAVAAAVATALMTNSAWAQDKPEATNLDEVVVTAQKVSQSVIDVPLSISVLGGDDLERTQSLNIQDYVKLVPGLQLTQAQPGFGRLVLRGINTGGVASTVGVYVDETTFGSSSGLANGAILAGDFDTFDVARVEVLRGPQGTLYGASSLGGVLKYVTQRAADRLVRRARARILRDRRWRRHVLFRCRQWSTCRCPTAWRFAPPASIATWAASSIRSAPRIRRGGQHQWFDRVGRPRVDALHSRAKPSHCS